MLSIAQFAYNATNTKTIKVSLFYANYDYNSDMAKHGTTAIKAQRANMMIEQLIVLQKKLAKNLRFITLRFKLYYDRRRFEEIDLKVRKKVFVLRRNMKITKKSNKLNHVKLELFRVLRNIKKINYKLKLSTNMKKKYSIFHISLLKSAHSNTSKTNISNDYIQRENKKKYEIEKILNKQLIDEEIHYLIK